MLTQERGDGSMFASWMCHFLSCVFISGTYAQHLHCLVCVCVCTHVRYVCLCLATATQPVRVIASCKISPIWEFSFRPPDRQFHRCDAEISNIGKMRHACLAFEVPHVAPPNGVSSVCPDRDLFFNQDNFVPSVMSIF